MSWEVVKRADTLSSRRSFISISRSHFAYNAHFSHFAELDRSKKVTIYTDAENRRLGFEFHTDERENAYTLGFQTGAKAGEKSQSMQSSAAHICNQIDWVRSVADLPLKTARRFIPNQEGKLWVIQLCPAFETRRARESTDIPSDAKGIYRYRSEGGDIVYIGQGALRDRLNARERTEWDFDRVEYSIVEDPDERVNWHTRWLERFRDDHGRLPLHNRQPRKQPSS